MAVEGLEEFYLDNFSQGLDRSDDPRNIATNSTPDTENTRFYGTMWTSRPGTEAYLNELTSVTPSLTYDGLAGWVENDSLLSAFDGSIYRANEATNQWVSIHSGLTVGEHVGFEEYLGDMYIGNAVEPFTRIVHTTYAVSTPAGAPLGDLINSWAEKMWVGGNKLFPRTLYYSRTALADHPEYIYDFGGAGSGSELLGKQGVLTGLSDTKNALIIFKDNECYYIRTFDATTLAPSIQQLSSAVGCVGKKAFTRVRDEIFFFTGSEVRYVAEFEGYPNLYTTSISKSIRRLIKDDLAEDQSDAVMEFNDEDNLLKLWVKSAGSSINDLCLVYHFDEENKTWTIDTGKAASHAVTFKGKTYFTASSFGQTYLDELGLTDDGGPITSYRWTKDRKIYSAKGLKKFREYYLAGSMSLETELTVRVYIDDILKETFTVTEADLQDTVTMPGGPIGADPIGTVPVGGVLVQTRKFQKLKKMNHIGRYIMIYVENATTGGYHEISDEVIRYKPLPRSAERNYK